MSYQPSPSETSRSAPRVVLVQQPLRLSHLATLPPQARDRAVFPQVEDDADVLSLPVADDLADVRVWSPDQQLVQTPLVGLKDSGGEQQAHVFGGAVILALDDAAQDLELLLPKVVIPVDPRFAAGDACAAAHYLAAVAEFSRHEAVASKVPR